MGLVDLRKTLTEIVGTVRDWALRRYDANVRDMAPPKSLGELCLEVSEKWFQQAVVRNLWSRPLKPGDSLRMEARAMIGDKPTTLTIPIIGEGSPREGNLPQTPRQLREFMWHRKWADTIIAQDDALRFLRIVDAARKEAQPSIFRPAGLL